MAYAPTTWVDETGTGNGTLVTAARMNNIEAQLAALAAPTYAATVPTLVPAASSFSVPTNTQALFAMPISVDGEIVIDGVLIEVN